MIQWACSSVLPPNGSSLRSSRLLACAGSRASARQGSALQIVGLRQGASPTGSPTLRRSSLEGARSRCGGRLPAAATSGSASLGGDDAGEEGEAEGHRRSVASGRNHDADRKATAAVVTSPADRPSRKYARPADREVRIRAGRPRQRSEDGGGRGDAIDGCAGRRALDSARGRRAEQRWQRDPWRRRIARTSCGRDVPARRPARGSLSLALLETSDEDRRAAGLDVSEIWRR